MSDVRRAVMGHARLRALANVAVETLRQAARSLRRAPGLVVTVVAVFALGIGANATMFETIDRLLLRAPPHVTSPEDVRRIFVTQGDPFTGEVGLVETFPFPDIADFEGLPAFDAVAAYSEPEITIGRGEDASAHPAVLAGSDYWRVLGTTPAAGRFFDATDDAPGAEPVAVIGHGYWRDRFGGSPSAIGETLDFGYGPYTIIGVAPRGLTTLDLGRVDVFLPLQVAGRHMRGEGWVASRQMLFLKAVARLSPDSNPVAVADAATARHLGGRSEDIAANRYYAEPRIVLGSLGWANGLNRSGDTQGFLMLSGVALVVLLITLLNVTNLLVGRAIQTRRESAVRVALGISRRRHVAQTLAEGAILGLAGATAAFLVDSWIGSVVRARLMPFVAWEELGGSGPLWIFLMTAGITVGLLSAVPAAIRASRSDVVSSLKGGGGGTPRSTSRLRAALCVVQAGCSVVLLIGTGLFLRSFDEILNADIGFTTEGLHALTLVTDPGSTTPVERQALLLTAAERLRRIPGVEGAAASSGNPFRGSISVAIAIPGVDPIPRAPSGGPYVTAVGEGYLRTMGVPVLRGRDFDRADHAAGVQLAIVGQTMARAMWGEEDPIGQCIHVGGVTRPCSTVVGVAADPHRSDLIGELDTFQYWIPADGLETDLLRPNNLAVRVSSPAVLVDVRRELIALDTRIRHVETFSYREWMPLLARTQSTAATLFTVFGALALIVAALGLYSVIAFDVAQRTREIGIRAALGASGSAVIRAVIGRGLRHATVGVALGLIAAAVLSPRVEEQLYGISPRDPATFALVAGVLLLVALVASGLPARRAAGVDPMIALRAE